MSTSPNASDRVRGFLQWFERLDLSEQEVLIALVYKEKKVRDVVQTFASMTQDQRQEVFERLGLPQEILSRLPPPVPSSIGDVDVEWVDWQTASHDS